MVVVVVGDTVVVKGIVEFDSNPLSVELSYVTAEVENMIMSVLLIVVSLRSSTVGIKLVVSCALDKWRKTRRIKIWILSIEEIANKNFFHVKTIQTNILDRDISGFFS